MITNVYLKRKIEICELLKVLFIFLSLTLRGRLTTINISN